MRRNLQRIWRSFHGTRWWNPQRMRRGFCGMRRNSQRMRRSFMECGRNSLRGVEQKTRARGGTRTRQRPVGESEGPLRGAHGRPRAKKRPERGSPCARRSPRTQRRRVKAGGRSGARAERRRATDKRTRREGRSDARGRTALRAPPAAGAPRRAGIARAPRASRAVPCVKHARHAPAAGVGSGARARTQREEAAGGREATRTRGPRALPPPSARTARSPRAPRALHEGGGSLASPRTRRHTDARRRRGAHSTARRAMKDRRTTRGENDSHYHPRTLFGCGGESRQTTRPHAASAPRGPRPSRCALDTGSLRAERRAK